MISYISGKLVEKQPTRAVIDVGGVGYDILIPVSSYDRLPATGENCHVFTYFYVREDQHVLYGFSTEAEKRMFLLLINASGVGPKIALSALSGMAVRDLKASIVGGDAKRLSTISGIGRKLAERLIVELRDKISDGEALEAISGADGATPEDGKTRDAIMALIALGYKQDQARKMAAAAMGTGGTAGLSVEEIVRKALSA